MTTTISTNKGAFPGQSHGFDDDYNTIAPMYNMTVKSHQLASAKKSLPFNVSNISKHSLKNKMIELDKS
jgi:hypothetical protein